MKRWRSLLLGFVLSGVFLWIALRGLAWDNVGNILTTARWGYVLAAIVIWSAGLAARAVRWRALMGGRTPLLPTYHILNIGFLVNNTLPFRVGELVRAYLIAQSQYPITGWAALSTIVAERILDMLAVVLMLAAVLPVLSVETAALTGALLIGGAALIGFGALVYFAHRQAQAQAIVRWVVRVIPPLARLGPESLLTRILDGLTPLTTWRGLAQAVLWTAISWALSAAGSWVLALAFPALPATPTLRAALTLSVVAASFSIIIPFTLASVGPFEAASVFALMTAAVSQEVAAAYSVVWHSGVVISYAVWGTVGMLALGLSMGQIRQGAAAFGQSAPSSE